MIGKNPFMLQGYPAWFDWWGGPGITLFLLKMFRVGLCAVWRDLYQHVYVSAAPQEVL